MRACMDRGKRGLGSGGGKGRAVWAVWSVVGRVCMGAFLFLLALSERDLALYLRSPTFPSFRAGGRDRCVCCQARFDGSDLVDSLFIVCLHAGVDVRMGARGARPTSPSLGEPAAGSRTLAAPATVIAFHQVPYRY